MMLILSSTYGTKQRLSNWNSLADPMLFPLLFPNGEVGYECNNSYRSPFLGDRERVSMAELHVSHSRQRGSDLLPTWWQVIPVMHCHGIY